MARNKSLTLMENTTKARQISQNIIFWGSYFCSMLESQSPHTVWRVFLAQLVPTHIPQQSSELTQSPLRWEELQLSVTRLYSLQHKLQLKKTCKEQLSVFPNPKQSSSNSEEPHRSSADHWHCAPAYGETSCFHADKLNQKYHVKVLWTQTNIRNTDTLNSENIHEH